MTSNCDVVVVNLCLILKTVSIFTKLYEFDLHTFHRVLDTILYDKNLSFKKICSFLQEQLFPSYTAIPSAIVKLPCKKRLPVLK